MARSCICQPQKRLNQKKYEYQLPQKSIGKAGLIVRRRDTDSAQDSCIFYLNVNYRRM